MNILPASQFKPDSPQPGIYEGVPIEIYHRSAGYSKTTIWLALQSPSLVEWARKAPRSYSEADVTGNAVHCKLLEPSFFSDRYTVMPKMDRRTNAGKEKYAEFMSAAEKNGTILLDDKELDKICEMSDSVMSEPEARSLLTAPGKSELTFVTIDEQTGLTIKCRADRKPFIPGVTLDIKTIDRIERIDHTFLTHGYHVQDAFYSDIIEKVTGEQHNDFIFAFVGKTREMGRYPVRILGITPMMESHGRSLYRKGLNLIADCETFGFNGIQTLDLDYKLKY